MAVACFITDSSLAQLARRLRFLGYDVAGANSATLERLFERAALEGRTVLTMSVRHSRRHAGVSALVVPRGDLGAALRRVVASYEPSGPPLSRCSRCNGVLESRAASEARGLPARVTSAHDPLRHCPRCDAWYWQGSHVRRLRAWLEAALGHPNAVPDPDGS